MILTLEVRKKQREAKTANGAKTSFPVYWTYIKGIYHEIKLRLENANLFERKGCEFSELRGQKNKGITRTFINLDIADETCANFSIRETEYKNKKNNTVLAYSKSIWLTDFDLPTKEEIDAAKKVSDAFLELVVEQQKEYRDVLINMEEVKPKLKKINMKDVFMVIEKKENGEMEVKNNYIETADTSML